MDKFKGITYDEFHKFRISRYPSLANDHDSNFNKMMKWKDDIDYGLMLEIDEQGNAKDVDYAHDLELDDIGYDVEVPRAGLDDEKYRFLIKSKRLSINSKGTFPDIINIASNLLGCDPEDIKISNDRKWKDGQLIGEDNTIDIDDINYENVNNVELVPFLASELEKSALASTKVREIGFYETVKTNMYAGEWLNITEHITETVDPKITEHGSSTGQSYIGVYPAIKELASFNIDGTIKEKQSISNQGYIGVQPAIKEIASFDIGNSINENGASIGGQSYIGVQPAIKEIANFDIGNSINESYSTDITNYFAMHVLEPYVFSRSKVQHYYMDISDGIVNRSNISITNYNGSHTIMGARIQI